MMNREKGELARNNVGVTCKSMKRLSRKFKMVKFSHIPRENNETMHVLVRVDSN